jgi:UDP-N-acetylglucosamine transferase subunit ALG13
VYYLLTMPYKDLSYKKKLIIAIEEYQYQELMSDRELSRRAWISITLVSKIKKWTTTATLSTLRKLKAAGVQIPKPERILEAIEKSEAIS